MCIRDRVEKKKPYKPKPYEQMQYPGQRVQIDVKVVPRRCIADPELKLDVYKRQTTAYDYGLERIAAYSENGVTRYVYDGRGSVAQAISAPVAGEAAASALPDILSLIHI